jgi:hypothetical protein
MSWVQVKELLYIYTLHRLRIIFSGRFILFLLQQTHHVDQTPRPKGSDSCVCKNSPKAYTFFFSFLFLSLEIGFINHSEYYYCFVKEMRKKEKKKKKKKLLQLTIVVRCPNFLYLGLGPMTMHVFHILHLLFWKRLNMNSYHL